MNIPHCPNPKCPRFQDQNTQDWYIHCGFHHTKVFGKVPRYQCNTCGRTFSTQTFSIDYYAKKIVDYQALQDQLISASGVLDIGRNLNISAGVVANRSERLARCCLAIQSDLLTILPFKENLAADGFESFSYSQFFPNHINIFAGSRSEFLYTMGFANLRRKGRMTVKQQEKRDEMELEHKADPKAVEKSFKDLTEDLTQRFIRKGITGRTLFTDEHKAYPRAFKKIKEFPLVFTHHTTSSRERRTGENPLFPVNYADRQFRKDISDHTRETVQFAHCPDAMMFRMLIYQYYHNCVIPRRVKEARKKNYQTHAEMAGITREDLERILHRHLGKRAFLGKVNLGLQEMNTWLVKWRNPGIEIGRYIPKYVFS